MTLPLIVYRSLRQHALSTWVTAAGIALACGLLMCVWMVKTQAQAAFTSTTSGFDAVLGARGKRERDVVHVVGLKAAECDREVLAGRKRSWVGAREGQHWGHVDGLHLDAHGG